MHPVLVVEDNTINRDVAVLQLKALGIPAESVDNGMDAIEAVKKKCYSAILMDVMMPDLNGWEACISIREFEKTVNRHTPIIAVSAWAAQDNREKCMEAGMDDYLPKPYSREELKNILSSWIKTEETTPPDTVPSQN